MNGDTKVETTGSTGGTTINMAGNADNESKVFGISIRAYLAIILTSTVCGLAFMKCMLFLWLGPVEFSNVMAAVDVTEPLYSMSVMVLGFYFGQKTKTA